MTNRYLIVGTIIGLGALSAVAAGALYYAGRTPLDTRASTESCATSDSTTTAATASKETKKMITSKIAESKSGKVEVATFGAGCFWGVESTFRALPGVLSTSVGYSGGYLDNPTYKDVCYKDTGHAEVVQIEFDPEEISYAKLLDVFWKNHDPTTINRQGPDEGSQYRSVVFYHNDAQRQAAEEVKEQLTASKRFGVRPIVTQIVQAMKYYPAEDYHQQYNEKRGRTSCHL